MTNLKTAKGLALEDILTEVHHYVHRSKAPFVYIAYETTTIDHVNM